MKQPLLSHLLAALLISAALFAQAPAPSSEELERTITEEQVVALVSNTCADLVKDAPTTLAKINKAEPPYKDAQNPTLYVFVYSPDIVMMAHPRPELVGKSMKGKPDVKGKKFRDEMVEKALNHDTGWVDYLYQKPGESGIHPKTSYCAKALGSDGQTYVVCSGKYQQQAK